MKEDATILVIDDELQIRRLLDITLSATGYRIISADRGKTGLIEAATHNPDLILLDLGLPDMDGQELLKQLREWYTQAIIILSVRDNETDIIQALDNGANDYLTKPFALPELEARVRALTRRGTGQPRARTRPGWAPGGRRRDHGRIDAFGCE